jgi:transposase
MPLSLVQLSRSARQEIIAKSEETAYEAVYKIEKVGVKETKKLVAKGFEQIVVHEGELEGKSYTWTERQLYVYSINHAQAQQHGFDQRIEKAELQIQALNVSKKGKPVLKTQVKYEEAIANILKINKVEGFISCEIKVTEEQKNIRAYGQYPARKEINRSFEVKTTREDIAIEEHRKGLGWQVYATNVSADLLNFESCVWKYRYQSNIESRFDDLRNKMAPLLPAYLHKDERIKGLVSLLLMALKVCSVIEYKVAKNLQDNKEILTNVFEGNPRRGTDRPSATRIFNAFEGISISLIFKEKKLQMALMTKLEPVQLKIMKLLGLKPKIYEDLSSKIQMFFTESHLSEI